MQISWTIKDAKNTRLLIIALGWGASPEVLGDQVFPPDTDVVTLCDYRMLDLDFTLLRLDQYTERYLVAWSFGVWASEQLFATYSFNAAIALAGTPHPIDRNFGIDPRVFAITLRGVLEQGVVAFITRMCGKHLREYLKSHSTRDLAEIQEELQILNSTSVQPYTPKLRWTKAVVCELDVIFSPRSTRRYWESVDVQIETLADTPHYPFYRTDLIACIIKN